MKTKSIASKFIMSVLPIMAVFTLILIIATYSVSKSQMDITINDKMLESLSLADSNISSILDQSAEISHYLSIFSGIAGEQYATDGQEYDIRKAEAIQYLQEMISSSPNIMGGGIWYEKWSMPKTFGGEKAEFYSHYVFYNNNNNTWESVDDYSAGGVNDFHFAEWYVQKPPGEAHWSGVYYDPIADVLMITATYSFYSPNGEFLGVTTIDMSLDSIQNITLSLKVGETGRAFLLGSNGEYICFFEEGKSIDEAMQNDSDKDLAATGDFLIKNREGQTDLVRGGTLNRLYFKTTGDTDWILALIIEEREISSSALNSIFTLIVVPLLGLLLTAASLWYRAYKLKIVTSKVTSFAGNAAAGNFSERIAVTENDEFGAMEISLNDMIEQMQKMSEHSAKMLEIAETASKSKSTFLSRMSHEIRTPMNAIIGMTQIARKSDNKHNVDDCLAKIDNASRHLLSLINDILDMSKIEANKLELVMSEFRPEKALTNIYNFIAFKVEEKKQKFTIDIDSNIPALLIGDEMRFAQVITNLLINAVKFTPVHGNINLSVKQIAAEGNHVTLEVSVSDNGIGMDEEQVSRLFKPFEQAERGTSRKYGGTGLGLSISKSIVEMAGGEISVVSEYGVGSCFTFTMRFLAVEKCDDNTDYDLGQLKVLVVDESSDALVHTEQLLKEVSVSCIVSSSSEDALEKVNQSKLQKCPFNLVFIAHIVPVLDAKKLSKSIRNIVSETEIVVISDLDPHGLAADLQDLHILDFLTEPRNSSDILDILIKAAKNISKRKREFVPVMKTLKDFTILLVEDVEINREIVCAALEETEINIEQAANGREALEKFQSSPTKFSLIFMDLQMPEMDGFEATKRIRELDGKVPIIAMTANAFKEDIDACLEVGMNGHIAKPINFETLLNCLKKYLN